MLLAVAPRSVARSWSVLMIVVATNTDVMLSVLFLRSYKRI
jgi:hypothetical protein